MQATTLAFTERRRSMYAIPRAALIYKMCRLRSPRPARHPDVNLQLRDSSQEQQTKKLSNGRLSARHRHCENIRLRERSFVGFDGDTIAKSDRASGVRGNAFARNYDADEIQRICCGNRRNFARRILFALGPQRFHGQGQGELLAQKPTDKPAATDFSAVFQASESNQHVSPFRKNGFARKKFAEDDSVAMQQHPTRRFKRPSMVVGITGIKQRPAASTVSRARGSSAALAGAPFG